MEDRETYLDRITTPTAIELFNHTQSQVEEWIDQVAHERLLMTQRERDNHPVYNYTFLLDNLSADKAVAVGEYFHCWSAALPYDPDVDVLYDVTRNRLRVQLSWNFSGGNRPDEDPKEPVKREEPRVVAVSGSGAGGKRHYQKRPPRS